MITGFGFYLERLVEKAGRCLCQDKQRARNGSTVGLWGRLGGEHELGLGSKKAKCPRQELNLLLSLRRAALCPVSYEGKLITHIQRGGRDSNPGRRF